MKIQTLIIGILLFFGLSAILRAEEDISSFPVQVNGDQVQYFDTEKKVVGQGNVVVTYKDIKLTCKKVTAFLESKEAIAEGDVVVTRGDEVLRGKKIVYNFQTETGVVTEGVAKNGVWYGGGEELRKISPQEIDIKDGYLTTCDLDKPHYRIQSKEVKIYLGKRIVAKNVTFNIGNVPVFYLPVYSQPINDKFSKVNFVPGRDKTWGPYLLSSYRYNLGEDVKGNVHLDYRQNKGFGEGLDYNFKTKDFGNGYLSGYFINENDKVQQTEKDRWRIEYRHKWEIQPDTVGVLEYHGFKDASFTKDYFYREEFERDPQPQSYLFVNHTAPGYTASILAVKRVNTFFTEVERLPEADFTVKNQRLSEGLPFFYKADFNAVGLNKRFADSDQANNTMRVDTYNQLSAPFRLVDFLSVDPYIATEQTFYSRELDTEKERFRGALYSGVDLSTNFYRIYDYKTDFLNLDINNVRHIFTPNINYFYVQKPTLLPGQLFEFDDVDTLDKKNGIGFIFENKLQTKRLENKELNTVELARWVIETDYLFRLGEQHDRLSNVSSDLEIRPYSWLFMKQTALADPKGLNLRSLNTDVVANDPKENWRLGLGHRYEQGFSSQLTSEAEMKITPKWKCRVFETYEFKGGNFKEQEYAITRDLHCWEAEVAYNVRQDGPHTFWFILRLKAFPEMPLKMGTSYYRPRTGPVND